MSSVFGADYAASYDALYADKDYDAECDLLEGIFRESGRPVATVLDLGCGTGAHAVRLALRGYDVVGVDVSDGMLDAARRRAEHAGSSTVSFVHGDIRALGLDRRFDAVICMFAVLGYQTTDEDVAKALDTVRLHLAPGGLFVFDVWYGPAVEATGPSARVKVVAVGDGELERQASAVLQADAHLCTVSYWLTRRRPGLPEVTTNETHRMRYFFRNELGQFLEAAGLRLVGLLPLPDTSAPLDSSSWNVLGTALG
ncbi:MAG TPA: class I SAM-dependent methyltransferase [Propionibacteriaceae bacterium]